MADFEGNPYQAPSTETHTAQPVGTGQPASRGARFGAALLDGLLSVVIVIPAQFAAGVYENFPQVKEQSLVQTALWSIGGFVVWLVLHGKFLADNGQTIGKKLVGIKIVNFDDGQKTDLVKIVAIRYLPLTLVALIPVVGPFLTLLDAALIFRSDQRCVHDHIAGTRVVQA